MQFIIVTGMSGGGKTTVLKFLEDIGYFCVDNLPPSLIPKFAEICLLAGSGIEKVALGIDIRGGRLLNDLLPSLEAARSEFVGEPLEFETQILFIEASDETIIKRYKETRRSHPLAKNDVIESGIAQEKSMLESIRLHADYIIDTTHLLTRQLKEKINELYLDNKNFDNLVITVISFGFKYGIPNDSDLVFDVRFLPNPFYIPEMKDHSGDEKIVSDYVMGFPAAHEFLDKLSSMLEFLIPHFRSEGKTRLVISVGCTGGKHRSVTLAIKLFEALRGAGHTASISHRDIYNG